ncbi:anti-sigma factor [Williamsia herbipolensis]|uniref:Regulator of SigK n=1 Tax=Williamsia herbipolensis TaxID=1603258 RepID=A0AAU4JY59_9NOCA|nr:anti-sigma factor [Williamsia herbipolensis]
MRPDRDPRELVDDLLELYAIDALDRSERASFEAALQAIDPERRVAAVIEIRRTHDAIARMAAEHTVVPPSAVRRSLLDAVSADRPGAVRPLRSVPADAAGPASRDIPALSVDEAPHADGPSHGDELAARRTRRRRLAMSVASAAAALLLVIGGVVIGRSSVSSPEPSSPAVAAGSVELEQLRSVMSAQDAEMHRTQLTGMPGTVVVASSRSMDTAVVLLDSAPVPANAQTYQLWLIGNTHAPKSAGLITDASASTPVIVHGLDQSRTVGMTMEPRGGSPQPTGDVLAAVSI